MIFKVRPISSVALATWMMLVSVPAMAQNNPQPRRSIVMTFSQAEAKAEVRELYVAIMGGVVRPGTYHLDPSELNLNSVLKRAGGLSSDATRSVRVIRHGRVSHQVILSDESDKSINTLLPGDVVVADSKQMTDTLGKITEFVQDPTTVRANYEVTGQPSGVQVALLNVLDYPLVVTLRPEEATVGSIIDHLGQPGELLANTRIIAPNIRSRGFDPTLASIQLMGGTAVVFDKGYVNRERLPLTLPKPIESDIAQGAQSGLIGSPRGQSQELRNVGQRVFMSSTGNADDSQSPVRTVPETAISNPPQFGISTDEQKPELTVPTVKVNPRVANVPYTGVSSITNSSAGSSVSESTVNEQIPQPEDTLNENSASTLTIAPSLTIEESVDAPPRRLSIPQMIAIFVASGGLIGGGLLLRRKMDLRYGLRTPVATVIPVNPVSEFLNPTTDVQAPAKTLLEKVIKNELPLTIEPVEFPSELVLQGRIATKPIRRVDDPQNVVDQNGPHFVPSNGELGSHTLQDVIAQMDAPESMPRRPHFMKAEKQPAAAAASSTPELRETTSSQVSMRSNAPLASALFELEQGGRS